jgi:hypothetical protein
MKHRHSIFRIILLVGEQKTAEIDYVKTSDDPKTTDTVAMVVLAISSRVAIRRKVVLSSRVVLATPSVAGAPTGKRLWGMRRPTLV